MALLFPTTLLLLSALHQTNALPSLTSPLFPRQSNNVYAGGNDGNNVDTNAGASGGKGGSFTLSTGGLIAIIVVVVAVVIFGVATTVLFVMAKRRQWDIRASIRRASRRITGRDAADRKSKRAGGIQLQSPPATAKGHKRGLMVEVKDVEKGRPAQKKQITPVTPKQSFMEKFLGPRDRPLAS